MTAALLAVPFMVSCQKENATLTTDGQKVSDIVVKSFEKKYPNAENVSWETRSSYWVAHFDLPSTKAAEAGANSTWFDNGGNWQMSEMDIDYAALPEAVRTAFEATRYADWVKDDVETLERNGVICLYVIEVEKKIGREEFEMELYFTADGILTREVPADEDHSDLIPEELPEALKDLLEQEYHGYLCVEAELEDGHFEVEILFEGKVFELKYTASLDWVSTEYEALFDELPKEIQEIVNRELGERLGFEIDDIDVIKTGLGFSYKIELENETTDEEIKIIINEKGEITIK